MKLGIYTGDFDGMGARQLFSRIAALGFHAVQLNFAAVAEAGYQNEPQFEFPASVEANVVARISEECARAGLTIDAVNGTFNCAHADPAVRAEGVKRFSGFADAVRALGCGYITLCTGTRNETSLWRPHPDNESENAWRDMRDTVIKLTRIAEEKELTLLIETEASNVVSTAERAARLLFEVRSDALKMIIDCANLFRAGEAKRGNVRAAIDAAFEAFGPAIALAHGKDIYESDGIAFAPTGKGIVDYPYFLRRLRAQNYTGNLILHGIFDEKLMAEAVAFLRPLIEGAQDLQ